MNATAQVNDDNYISQKLEQIMAAAANKDADTLEAIIDRIYLDGFNDGQSKAEEGSEEE